MYPLCKGITMRVVKNGNDIYHDWRNGVQGPALLRNMTSFGRS